MEPSGKDSPKTPTPHPDFRLSHPCIAPHSCPISCSRLSYLPPGHMGPPCFAWILAHCLAVRKPCPGRRVLVRRRILGVLLLSGSLSPAARCSHLENSDLPCFSQSDGGFWREGSSASNYSAGAGSCPCGLLLMGWCPGSPPSSCFGVSPYHHPEVSFASLLS